MSSEFVALDVQVPLSVVRSRSYGGLVSYFSGQVMGKITEFYAAICYFEARTQRNGCS